MQWETLFYLRNKWIAQLAKLFTHVLQNRFFLRYKKISQKAVKLGSFLQCLVHIFLGCFWKINLRILWNNIMKYFQVKQCDNFIPPQNFSFESCKQLLDLCLAVSRILFFWQVLESIHSFFIKLHALQCLFVRESNKQQRKGTIILIFTKGDTFSSFMTT